MATTIAQQINGGLYAWMFRDRPHATFLDIGANIGLVSIFAHDSCDTVVAVEPDAKHFSVLKTLCEPMGVQCINAALWHSESSLRLYRNVLNTTMHSVINGPGSGGTAEDCEVQCFPLSYFVRSTPFSGRMVDLIKIDIEGAETEALTKQELLVCRPNIRTIYVEVHPTPARALEQNLQLLIQRFIECGYTASKLSHESISATVNTI